MIMELGKLHDEELDNIYCSPNIIQIIKSRGMRRAGRVASMRKKRYAYMILVRKQEGERTLGERIILRWVLAKWYGVVWTG
jgi:hypothetical protein